MNFLSYCICWGKKYVLAGYSLHRPGHFVSVVYWRGKKYRYDGMGLTNNTRLQAFKQYDCEEEGSHMLFI